MGPFKVGDVIHGFAAGSFGRDSYACRRVEAVGADWIVTRNTRGEAELATGRRIPTREEATDQAYCSDGCELLGDDDRLSDAHVDFIVQIAVFSRVLFGL